MHLLALGAFWSATLFRVNWSARGLNAPFGARCFLTRIIVTGEAHYERQGLNAPFGARCCLTARRVAPPVTRDNVVSDRQWSKKHPSGQQA